MTPAKARKLHLSVFLKCAAILTIATAVVAGVISVSSDRTIRNLAYDGLRQISIQGTEVLAESLVGALRFRKIDDVESTVSQFSDDRAKQVLGSVVLLVDGTEVVNTERLTEPELAQLKVLAQVAISTGNAENTFDGFWRSQPVIAGGTIVGAVAVAWSPAEKIAVIDANRRSQLILAGSVFVVLTLASGLFIRQTLAQPLKKLADRTIGMAEGDLTTDVPFANRRDEIGQIAMQLDGLREKLHAADAATQDALYKSAGFHNASAPLVMTDPEFRITHSNPAFTRLLECSPSLAQNVPGLDAASAIGTVLDPRVIGGEQLLGTELQLPLTTDFVLGSATFSMVLNSIKDTNGAISGYIMEWADVTEMRVTEAVLGALEAAQIRVDFDADGALLRFNDVARAAAPKLQESPDLSLARLIRPTSSGTIDGILREKTAHFDTFTFAEDRTVSGILSPIEGAGGATSGYVFLGHDITDSEASRHESEDRRMRQEEAQKTVVTALHKGLSDLADGNLTTRLTAPFPEDHEKLRMHFNASMEAMESAVGSVRDNASTILKESDNIAGAADDLSRRTEHQAATLEEFAASLTELTASVAATADGADQASQVVTTARTNAETSGAVVQEAVEAMGEISQSSERIGRIISVIDDIAFQTNLLALNAGVEAARAGDAGRGFAVVASEVRALAQRSSDAASEINDLISSSSAEVKRGVSLVGRAGEALESIVGSIGGIADHVAEIAASARDQSTGIDEINVAMSQLDQATQQNVAMFEETTAATHTLRNEASSLVEASQKFSVNRETAHALPLANKPVSLAKNPTPPGSQPPNRPLKTDGPLALAADEDDEWENF